VTAVNLGLRFLLELCMLAAVAFWGVDAGGGTPARVGLGVAAPVAVAVVWGLAISPKARFRPGKAWWVLLQLALFGLAAAALVAAGHPFLGAAFGILSVANLAVLLVQGGLDVAAR
jgi:cytochrome b